MKPHQAAVPAHGNHHLPTFAQLDSAAFSNKLKQCAHTEGRELSPARLARSERPSLFQRSQVALALRFFLRGFR